MDPLFYDEAPALSAQKEKRELAARQRVDDVEHQMSTVQGRRFVWSILSSARVEGGGSLFDAHAGRQSYNLGVFEEGRKLAEELRDLCPDQYMDMVRENKLVNNEE